MRRFTLEEFLMRAREKHGDKYDYSLVELKNCVEKVKVICAKHGIFEKTPTMHMHGEGCPKCTYELKSMTTESFIKEAIEIHKNKYDYSDVAYVKSNIPVKITCPDHGPFLQRPNGHLSGSGCPRCGVVRAAKSKFITLEEFLDRVKKVHGDRYDYSKVSYIDNSTKIIIICPLHGEFSQDPSAHLNDRGCPLCHESRGERKVALFLEARGILYQRQKKFDGCRYRRKLSFDFFLPDHNICVEFDGRQHFFPSKYFGGDSEFERTKKVDQIKGQFCLNNGIELIRVPYRVKNVGSFLDKALSRIIKPISQ